MDHPHLLPKPVAVDPWPSWTPSKIRRFGEDGSLEINLPEGTWRDHRTGEGGGIFSLLARQLGSREAARSWLRAHGYSAPLRLDPIPPRTEGVPNASQQVQDTLVEGAASLHRRQ